MFLHGPSSERKAWPREGPGVVSACPHPPLGCHMPPTLPRQSHRSPVPQFPGRVAREGGATSSFQEPDCWCDLVPWFWDNSMETAPGFAVASLPHGPCAPAGSWVSLHGEFRAVSNSYRRPGNGGLNLHCHGAAGRGHVGAAPAQTPASWKHSEQGPHTLSSDWSVGLVSLDQPVRVQATRRPGVAACLLPRPHL